MAGKDESLRIVRSELDALKFRIIEPVSYTHLTLPTKA